MASFTDTLRHYPLEIVHLTLHYGYSMRTVQIASKCYERVYQRKKVKCGRMAIAAMIVYIIGKTEETRYYRASAFQRYCPFDILDNEMTLLSALDWNIYKDTGLCK